MMVLSEAVYRYGFVSGHSSLGSDTGDGWQNWQCRVPGAKQGSSFSLFSLFSGPFSPRPITASIPFPVGRQLWSGNKAGVHDPSVQP